MYLEQLEIKNFRSIKATKLTFRKGLNIIIGENNSGKSTVIDALRICLSYGRQYRDIGINKEEDFHIDNAQISDAIEPIHFTLKFKIDDDQDVHYFTSLVYQDPDHVNNQHLQMDFIYEINESDTGNKTLRWHSYGGGTPGRSIDPEEVQFIYYTYLAPLRNAEQELKPYAKENKITSLFQELSKYNFMDEQGAPQSAALNTQQKKSLAGKLEDVVNGKEWSGLLLTGEQLINEHLLKADISQKESRVQLKLLEYKYENIVKAITTKKPVYPANLLVAGNEHRQKYFEVTQNGLGENNLIYSAAVLGDLKNRRTEKKEHYYALFIEEPEAHLHPQRQNTFFNYLNNLQGLEVQIFITSHSPTITAKSDLDSLIVMQNQSSSSKPFIIRNSELSGPNKSYLRKFLDVTKSQLFFSNGTILVEGISEALLLPIFSRILNVDYDLEKNGVEIVNISGVGFEAFARIYNSEDVDKRLPSRCAILSDNDKGQIEARNFQRPEPEISALTAKVILSKLKELEIVDSTNRIVQFVYEDELDLEITNVEAEYIKQVLVAKQTAHSPRAIIAQTYHQGNLMVKLAEYTFEYELMTASEANYVKMIAVYSQMHPQTDFLPNIAPIAGRAFEFLRKLDSNKDKSEFAESLAFYLDQGTNKEGFVIPIYIKQAIEWVLKIQPNVE